MTLRQIVRRYVQHILALVAMVGLAVSVALYVAVHERLRFPWQGQTRIFAELPDDTWFYPGHGDDSTLGRERPSLPEWRARGW